LKKKKRENKNQFTAWIIATILLFAYFLIVLLTYSSQMKKEAASAVQDELEEHANKLVYSFSKNIATVNQTATTTSVILAQDADNLFIGGVDKLQAAVDSSFATYGFIADSTGAAVDIKGNSLDVWQDVYYAEALSGVQTISDIEIDEEGSSTIRFYAPISNGGSVRGVLCLSYPADQFARLPRTSEHDGQTVYALMKNDGTLASIVGKTVMENGQNLYSYISDVAGASEDEAQRKLKQNLDNGKSGQQFVMIDGREKFLNYRIVGTNDWYVLEIYTSDYFARLQRRNYRSTQKVLVKMIVALFLFFGVVLLLNLFSKALYKKKNEELQSKAETDLLTGLLNKIATERHIQDYIDGEGSTEPGMLFVLDIDNFKKINDTMGHAFGDQVLSTLGVRLRNQFRSSDIIGRIGGDEFIVYLKNVSDKDAQTREIERLLGFFKDFQAGDYVKYSVTASIGVALYPQDGSSFEEIYKAADKGVYLSKKRGKNQIAYYEETKNHPINENED